MAAGIDTRNRYPWTAEDERFLIAAKRERFGTKTIASFLERSPSAVANRLAEMREAGVLLCQREEEIDLLQRLLDEARSPELHPDETQ